MPTPVLHEILPTMHEKSIPYDHYAIAARKSLPGTRVVKSTVGHLPREMSRLTHSIVQHGAIVVAKVLDIHHHRSPLLQGGLEIPIELREKWSTVHRTKMLCLSTSLSSSNTTKSQCFPKDFQSLKIEITGLLSRRHSD